MHRQTGLMSLLDVMVDGCACWMLGGCGCGCGWQMSQRGKGGSGGLFG